MTDGSVQRIRGMLSRDEAVALLSASRSLNEEVGDMGQVSRRIHYGNWIRFASLIVIVVLPTPWAIAKLLKRRTTSHDDE